MCINCYICVILAVWFEQQPAVVLIWLIVSCSFHRKQTNPLHSHFPLLQLLLGSVHLLNRAWVGYREQIGQVSR